MRTSSRTRLRRLEAAWHQLAARAPYFPLVARYVRPGTARARLQRLLFARNKLLQQGDQFGPALGMRGQ
jgi:hypothetical protein